MFRIWKRMTRPHDLEDAASLTRVPLSSSSSSFSSLPSSVALRTSGIAINATTQKQQKQASNSFTQRHKRRIQSISIRFVSPIQQRITCGDVNFTDWTLSTCSFQRIRIMRLFKVVIYLTEFDCLWNFTSVYDIYSPLILEYSRLKLESLWNLLPKRIWIETMFWKDWFCV